MSSIKPRTVTPSLEVLLTERHSWKLADRKPANFSMLTELAVGYGLPIAKAREWGLFISKAIKEGEPASEA